jgi:hypothetical protein
VAGNPGIAAIVHGSGQTRNSGIRRPPFADTALNSGYRVVAFVVMGTILGGWR